MGIWMTPPLLVEDQVVPHTPEPENDYNLAMPLQPTPISSEQEPEDEEEEKPFEEEGSHGEDDDGNSFDSSPYLDSSSSDDPSKHAKPEEECEPTVGGDLEPNSSLDTISSLPPPSHQSYRLRIMGPRQKFTLRKSTLIPYIKQAISPPSSPVSPKKPFPTFPWTPQVWEWHMEDIIGSHYEVGKSSRGPTPTPIFETLAEQAISVFIPHKAKHAD